MDPYDTLELGGKYSKKDLAEAMDQENIALVREGVYNCKNSDAYLLFVDLEKKDKQTRFHFDDFFEGEFFHWDSQTTQHIESPKIQDIINGVLTPHLFVRVIPKINGVTQPFVYCGRLTYSDYEAGTSKPVHMVFRNLDYDDFTENEDLIDIYLWKPSKIGKSTKSKIQKRGEISKERLSKYKKPNTTERQGLVTSRVGQGYYRQQIIEKWEGKCPISGIDILPILISSHIVPWADATDEERLDVENGILLSPLYDSLFDKHLISFDDEGKIVISDKIRKKGIDKFGITDDTEILITEGMKKYLARHRRKLAV
jgi:hypothetical protein